MRANANVNCYCIICIHVVPEFIARIKRWVEFVIFWSRKIFLTWEKLEDAQNLNKGCRFSQQSSIESREQITQNKTLLIDYKQRDRSGSISLAGIANQESRHKNRESSLDSRLDSREDRESSVNLLLNGNVCFFWGGVGGKGFAVTGALDKVNFSLSLCWQAPEPGDFVLINSSFPRRISPPILRSLVGPGLPGGITRHVHSWGLNSKRSPLLRASYAVHGTQWVTKYMYNNYTQWEIVKKKPCTLTLCAMEVSFRICRRTPFSWIQ